MPPPDADAVVLFGATGDLAEKTLYPALLGLAESGRLAVPVIGVGRATWDATRFAAHVQESVRAAEVDDAGFAALGRLLCYVGGDLRSVETLAKVRGALGRARHPLYYLAIPPDLFADAIEGIGRVGSAGARMAIEKPFGHDLASARELDARLRSVLDEEAIFRVDHFLAKWPVRNLLRLRYANAVVAALWSREHIASVQITMAETFGVDTRGKFYDRVGALRDVVQNHLLQIVALLAMEAPAAEDAQTMHASRIELLESIRPAKPIVRGQYAGYREIGGVAPDSDTETFVALRLTIDSPRWRGVPFFIRAGKELPLTTTEVWVELQPPAHTLYPGTPDHFRLRLGPGKVDIGVGISIGEPVAGAHAIEIEPKADLGREHDRDAYVRLLGDALRGDRTVFERSEAIMAQWRVIDPLQREPPPVEPYARGTWGPAAAQRIVTRSGWHDPAPMP
ncbi:MAG TPA: glucose-6-phosphate dehydrogenase (NADP(+)) [Casimicrobiaceae bacterium]